jgi:hypothetical protein
MEVWPCAPPATAQQHRWGEATPRAGVGLTGVVHPFLMMMIMMMMMMMMMMIGGEDDVNKW